MFFIQHFCIKFMTIQKAYLCIVKNNLFQEECINSKFIDKLLKFAKKDLLLMEEEINKYIKENHIKMHNNVNFDLNDERTWFI